MNNSYYQIGYDDYLFAKDAMSFCKAKNNYNTVAGILAQSGEKLLKEIIEKKFAEDSSCISLLKTHNLRTLLNKIKEKYPNCSLESMECKWLGDFYFDARYPGDNFIVVNEDDANKALDITEKIIESVNEILEIC